MKAMEKLNEHLRRRPAEVLKLKKEGKKVIAYTANGYFPPEIVLAAGGIPICLGKGGDPEAVTESLSLTPLYLDTYSRCQIAYWKLGEDPYYQMPDLFVTTITDANSKVVSDSFDFYTKIPGVRLGVPHDHRPVDQEYFLHSLTLVKEAVENCTGVKITDEALKAELELGNKKRTLLKQISELRRGADPVISNEDYVAIHHAAFYADRDVYLECLEEIYEELKAQRAKLPEGVYTKPRFMLIGSSLAHGDVRIHELMAKTNAEIVCEDVAEGMVQYEANADLSLGVWEAIVDCYFTQIIRFPWDRPWADRFERLLAKAKEYDAQCVLWYQLLYRDGYDLQSWTYKQKFKAEGLPFVKLETAYAAAEKGMMRTRLETAVEMLQGGEEAFELA